MPSLNSTHSPTGPSLQKPQNTTALPVPFSSSLSCQPNGLTALSANLNRHHCVESRRGSVTNNVHHGTDNLGLVPTSPCTSSNASDPSPVANIYRERRIQQHGHNSSRYSTLNTSAALSTSSRCGQSEFVGRRVAPPTLENPKQEARLPLGQHGKCTALLVNSVTLIHIYFRTTRILSLLPSKYTSLQPTGRH